jgi:hypothetical protein
MFFSIFYCSLMIIRESFPAHFSAVIQVYVYYNYLIIYWGSDSNFGNSNIRLIVVIKINENTFSSMEKETTAFLNLSTTNPESEIEDKTNHREHSRRIFYEALKERGITYNSITGEKIDEKSDIDTLLQVIQNEKKKNKEQDKTLQFKLAFNKSAEVWPPSYAIASELWQPTYELYKFWLSYLVLNPFVTWLGFLMYDH